MKRVQTYDEVDDSVENWLEYSTPDPGPVAQLFKEHYDVECIYIEPNETLVIPCTFDIFSIFNQEGCQAFCDEMGLDIDRLFY